MNHLPLAYWIALFLGLAALAFTFWKLAKDAPEACQDDDGFWLCQNCTPQARRHCPYFLAHDGGDN